MMNDLGFVSFGLAAGTSKVLNKDLFVTCVKCVLQY